MTHCFLNVLMGQIFLPVFHCFIHSRCVSFCILMSNCSSHLSTVIYAMMYYPLYNCVSLTQPPFQTTTQVQHCHLLGSVSHEKLCYQLTKTRLVNAIKQASPISQTSCLEGFHSLLNHFSPKEIPYSFPGMYCR